MPLYILDTDHVSFFQGRHPVVVQRVPQTASSQLATTIVTVQEQIEGRFKYIKQVKGTPKLMNGYRSLQDTIAYFNTIHILPFDQAAYDQYTQLRQQKLRIGTQDLRIAAIALSREAIVVTRNQRDFGFVPNLLTVDWSV